MTLAGMIVAGARSVRRYKGLVVALYAVQLLVVLGAAMVITQGLAAAFAQEPMFDRATSGDGLALLVALRAEPSLFAQVFWIVLGTAALWGVMSWFLHGGLIAVIMRQPDDRAETAATFGAGGATTFPAYARLAVVTLIPYGVTVGVAAFGFAWATDDIFYALSVWDVIPRLALGLAPAAVLMWILHTAVDYARIDISARRVGAARAFGRALKTIFTRRQPLVHVLLYYGAFLAISLVYVALTFGFSYAGAGGAIALFLLRQVAAGARFAARVATVAGQVELGRPVE